MYDIYRDITNQMFKLIFFRVCLKMGYLFHTVNDDKPGNRTETMAEARSAADDRDDDEEVDEMNTDFQLHFWCRWVWNGDVWMARIFRCWVAERSLVTATGFGHCPGDDEKSTSEDLGRGTGNNRRDVFRDLPVPRRSYFLMLVDVPALVAQRSKLWWPWFAILLYNIYIWYNMIWLSWLFGRVHMSFQCGKRHGLCKMCPSTMFCCWFPRVYLHPEFHESVSFPDICWLTVTQPPQFLKFRRFTSV